MSDLQIVLIVVGVFIIVTVLFINWWQERRFHRQMENSFSPLRSDALLDDPTLELTDFNDDFTKTSADHFTVDEVPFEEVAPKADFSSNASNQFNSVPAFNSVAFNLSAEKKPDSFDVQLSSPPSKASFLSPKSVEQVKLPFDNADVQEPEVAVSDLKPREEAVVQVPKLMLPSMLNAQIDLTAVLYLVFDVPIGTLLNTLKDFVNGYDKPVFLHLLDSGKKWTLLQDIPSDPQVLNRQVSHIACSLQLADRSGAVSDHILARFQKAVAALSAKLGGRVEWQSTGDALAAATALDAFCIEVDKTIGFHLTHGANGAFTGTKLKGLAEAQGFVLAPDGTFKYIEQPSNAQSFNKQQAQVSFIMFNRDAHPFSPEMLRNSVVKSVSFQLDIPHVKNCAETFSQMVQVAKQMETGLNAMLVDDNNKALGEPQIDKIRQQLKAIQATMQVRGIAPGSDSALRLFS